MIRECNKETHPINVVTIGSNESVAHAAKLLRSKGVGCLIVTNEDGSLAGIITERDIACRAAADLLDLEKTDVSQIMTKDVICCASDTEPRKAREMMASNHIRHLPVVENGKAVRMYSLRDVVQQQLIDARFAAEQVAMLWACLKSISLLEIVNMVVTEVPKLFDAKRCVLYFHQNLSGPKEAYSFSGNNCLCPSKELAEIFKEEKGGEGCRICTDCIPAVCSQNGAESPRVVIQLKINKTDGTIQQDDSSKEEKGYLCMCGLKTTKASGGSLLYYKAKLVKDILNSHITNVAQYQDAKKASNTDSLTQVGSRKFFFDVLENESSRADRYGNAFSVAIIDVDNFKEINDNFGHVTGDLVLQRIAECMNNQKRNCDTLARYGGDEFVFILPQTTCEEATVMIERIQKSIREILVIENHFLTVSCGIVRTVPGQPVIPTELVSRADTALYQAKQAGRNCIKIWNENSCDE